jgi:2-polyprenyl-6-methoxyphenol hydroxylase-like FAD-dependent oxidoreductase
MGCVEEIEKRAVVVTRTELGTGGRTLGTITFAGRLNSRFNAPRLLAQSETERILRARFLALGGRVEFDTELLGFADDGSSVSVELRLPSGESTVDRASFLVGCDGAHSLVRHKLGLDFVGTALDETFLLADVAIDPAPDIHALQIDWQAGSLFALFPIREGMWRIVATRKQGVDAKEPTTLQEIYERLAVHGRSTWKLGEPEWLTSFRINERLVDTYRKGRILLAGDAAHIHSPAGGQGMNTGIQDAADLGWRLGLLVRGVGDLDLLLDSYVSERRPVAEKVLRDSTRMTRMALMKNPAAKVIRNLLVSAATKTSKVQNQFVEQLSGLEISYAGTPLIDDDRNWPEDWQSYGCRPGVRVADPLLEDPGTGARTSLHSWLKHTGHTLILLSGIQPDARTLAQLESFEAAVIAGVRPDDLRVVRIWKHSEAPRCGTWLLDRSGEAHSNFASEFPSAVLVRPDGRVALRSSPPHPESLRDYVGSVLIAQTDLLQ